MNLEIRDKLLAAADGQYRDFTAALIPGCGNIIGVRMPVLRGLAQSIARGDWRAYLAEAWSEFHEEIMLQGLVIGYARAGVAETLGYAAGFVPKITNWSLCDSFCSQLATARRNQAEMWDFLQRYAASEREFELRFVAVMLLDYYMNKEYIVRALDALKNISHPGYYAQAGVAWAVAEAYVEFPAAVNELLHSRCLPPATHNLAIRKMIESRRVSARDKEILRTMKNL